MLDLIKEVWDFANYSMNMSPALMIAVFITVELSALIFGVKNMCSVWRESILGAMCLIAGILISSLAFFDSPVQKIIHDGIILGGMSAIFYQIFKPFCKVIMFSLIGWAESKIDNNSF
jgi:xanthine/uracil permease